MHGPLPAQVDRLGVAEGVRDDVVLHELRALDEPTTYGCRLWDMRLQALEYYIQLQTIEYYIQLQALEYYIRLQAHLLSATSSATYGCSL